MHRCPSTAQTTNGRARRALGHTWSQSTRQDHLNSCPGRADYDPNRRPTWPRAQPPYLGRWANLLRQSTVGAARRRTAFSRYSKRATDEFATNFGHRRCRDISLSIGGGATAGTDARRFLASLTQLCRFNKHRLRFKNRISLMLHWARAPKPRPFYGVAKRLCGGGSRLFPRKGPMRSAPLLPRSCHARAVCIYQ